MDKHTMLLWLKQICKNESEMLQVLDTTIEKLAKERDFYFCGNCLNYIHKDNFIHYDNNEEMICNKCYDIMFQ